MPLKASSLRRGPEGGRKDRRLQFKGKNEGGKDGDGKPGCVEEILCKIYSSVSPPGLPQIPLSADTK